MSNSLCFKVTKVSVEEYDSHTKNRSWKHLSQLNNSYTYTFFAIFYNEDIVLKIIEESSSSKEIINLKIPYQSDWAGKKIVAVETIRIIVKPPVLALRYAVLDAVNQETVLKKAQFSILNQKNFVDTIKFMELAGITMKDTKTNKFYNHKNYNVAENDESSILDSQYPSFTLLNSQKKDDCNSEKYQCHYINEPQIENLPYGNLHKNNQRVVSSKCRKKNEKSNNSIYPQHETQTVNLNPGLFFESDLSKITKPENKVLQSSGNAKYVADEVYIQSQMNTHPSEYFPNSQIKNIQDKEIFCPDLLKNTLKPLKDNTLNHTIPYKKISEFSKTLNQSNLYDFEGIKSLPYATPSRDKENVNINSFYKKSDKTPYSALITPQNNDTKNNEAIESLATSLIAKILPEALQKSYSTQNKLATDTKENNISSDLKVINSGNTHYNEASSVYDHFSARSHKEQIIPIESKLSINFFKSLDDITKLGILQNLNFMEGIELFQQCDVALQRKLTLLINDQFSINNRQNTDLLKYFSNPSAIANSYKNLDFQDFHNKSSHEIEKSICINHNSIKTPKHFFKKKPKCKYIKKNNCQKKGFTNELKRLTLWNPVPELQEFTLVGFKKLRKKKITYYKSRQKTLYK
ncbi:hypothetical protein QEN19_000621 [Hanseniaspora menglaensis]